MGADPWSSPVLIDSSVFSSILVFFSSQGFSWGCFPQPGVVLTWPPLGWPPHASQASIGEQEELIVCLGTGMGIGINCLDLVYKGPWGAYFWFVIYYYIDIYVVLCI